MNATTARSWLFVPGDRPERFGKAVASGADAIIIDLEDAVAPERKQFARDQAARYLGEQPAYVRINAFGTQWHDGDLRTVTKAPGLRGIVLPKSETVNAITRVVTALSGSAPVIALVESALGVLNAPAVAVHAARLAFGNLDFSLDAGTAADQTALLYARSALVLASRAAGLPGPVDGVTPALDDPGAAARDAAHGKTLGFAGKLCVHPRQVDAVNAAYSYDATTEAWARRILAAAGPGGAAARVDGHMIDKPLLELARHIQAAAQAREALPDENG